MTDKETVTKPKTWKDTLWSITKLLLKLAVTSALLYYVFSKIEIGKVKNLILQSNPWWMLAALLCFFTSTIVSASRLLSFFKSIHLRLGTAFNLRLYLLGMFYNLCLPGGIGGDGYKIYLLNQRYNLPAKKVFWAILFDRLSGFWAIGLITVALILFVPQVEIHIAIPLTIFLAGTAVYYFVARRFFKEYTHYFFEAHIKAVGVQSLQVLTVLMVLLGLHFDGKFAPYLLSFLMSSLAAVFPFTLGGLGAREYIFTWLSTIFDMNANLAVFVSLSFYVISAIVSLVGVYYVFREDKLEEGVPPVVDEDEELAQKPVQ
ncbi:MULTISPECIES: lysylphosphatidylglycerol synthase transmembrane domain-containing protein [unclassified Mucilaginibacter]|uniref:lysylphosphatidylglycerol synthase transmembrane domain-containing protein n=1 Tax=unclassified Mucilaginibacter TaxID=2617802 RepID=UPI0031F615D1